MYGNLLDTTRSQRLASETIAFTATSSISIGSKITNIIGQYSATGLITPNTAGIYNIQSHFAGDALYNEANSPTQTLTVTAVPTAGHALSSPSTVASSTNTTISSPPHSPLLASGSSVNTTDNLDRYRHQEKE